MRIKLSNMKKLILLFGIFLCLNTLVQSQNVVINEDFPIGQIMDRYIQINKSTAKVEGWRIQVMATTDRSKVETAKTDFQRQYPTISVDWTHSKPYYRLRAGAFSTKLEASKLLYQLKKDYPGAYLTEDKNISPLELIGS